MGFLADDGGASRSQGLCPTTFLAPNTTPAWPAEGRASRAEALLRKVDERKAAAEVERRRAAEAAGRLEQQVRWLPAGVVCSCMGP